jgi:putative GTP pyrophosphokinase
VLILVLEGRLNVFVYNGYMNHHQPPTVSKKQVNTAGNMLRSYSPDSSEYIEALDIANQWRLAHIYPINTFQARLRKMVGNIPGSLVAQRLKRMPTIIDKLDRHKHMQLSTMQDIGGVRAILPSISDVYSVVNRYKTSPRFTHILKDEKNYITNPKPDGYRGIHLIYRYNNTLARNSYAELYKGLMVEVQLRTKEQHTWATAVETMSTLLDQPLKTRGGTDEWNEFFALLASAIAIVEKVDVLDQHKELTPLQIYKKIADMATKIHALDIMQGYSLAANVIDREKTGFYNIISLDTDKKTVSIKAFAKERYESAVSEYAKAERSAGEFQDVVLVSAGKLKSLKQAYPNYFLDITEFVKRIRVIIEAVEEVS